MTKEQCNTLLGLTKVTEGILSCDTAGGDHFVVSKLLELNAE